jgi:hypothetical protein
MRLTLRTHSLSLSLSLSRRANGFPVLSNAQILYSLIQYKQLIVNLLQMF